MKVQAKISTLCKLPMLMKTSCGDVSLLDFLFSLVMDILPEVLVFMFLVLKPCNVFTLKLLFGVA